MSTESISATSSISINRLDAELNLFYCVRNHGRVAYYRISSWHNGLFQEKLEKGQWEIDNRAPHSELFKNREIITSPSYRFVQNIPENLVLQARNFAYLETLLLQWASRSISARQLLAELPILLWLVADTAQNKGWRARKIIATLRCKRKVILKLISTTAKEQQVNPSIKLLRKIIINKGDHNECELIKRMLNNPNQLKRLRHLPRIPVHVLTLLEQLPDLHSFNLLSDVIDRTRKEAAYCVNRVTELWNDTGKMGQELGDTAVIAKLNNCSEICDLQLLHDNYVRRLNMTYRQQEQDRQLKAAVIFARHEQRKRDSQEQRHQDQPNTSLAREERTRQLRQERNRRLMTVLIEEQQEQRERRRLERDQQQQKHPRLIQKARLLKAEVMGFGAPPIPGDWNIKAILTPTELRNEGTKMHHCVGCYVESVLRGEAYFYHVNRPESATLQLILTENGPKLGQIRLVCNKHPNQKTIACVEKWFAKSGRSVIWG